MQTCVDLECRLEEIYQQNKNAIIRVKGIYKKEQASPDEKPEYLGTVCTGFFISKEGHLLANASVANKSTDFWVEHKGVQYEAELVGVEPMTSLAILKLKKLPEDSIDALTLSESSNNQPNGSLVLSLSYPYNLSVSPAMGMISGYDGEFLDNLFSTYYYRVTIPTVPGEAGAPVFDLNGRLIGMRVVSIPELQSSYVLPVNAIMRVRDDLLYNHAAKFGYVGLEAVEVDIGQTSRRIIINRVLHDSPAAKAGIHMGDVLLKLGDFDIHSMADVRNAAFFSRPGQFLTVKLIRMGKPIQVSIKVETPPPSSDLATQPQSNSPTTVSSKK